MPAWAVTNMGGEVPKTDPTLLPDNRASQAWNCDLLSGPLNGLNQAKFVVDLSAWPDPVRAAYRVPPPQGAANVPERWLALPSPYSAVVLSPLKNDLHRRVYWTNPSTPYLKSLGLAGAFWSPFDSIDANGLHPPYNLGFVTPDPNDPKAVLNVDALGGTTSVPKIERVYLYTYLDAYGSESAPSAPSLVHSSYPDSQWRISHFPGTPGFPVASAPAGKHYPPPQTIRLYRTITGTSGQTTYYRVGDFSLDEIARNPATFTPYLDTAKDTAITGGLVLGSTGYASAPDDLDGLLVMPGGFFVGFTGNTLHFSEPYRPHAWPSSYDLSVQHKIVALALWNSTLVALTEGYPSTGTGTAPAAFTLAQVQVAEPCIARGSVVTDLLGVYYASPNGLLQLSYYGVANQTEQLLAQPQWLTNFMAPAAEAGAVDGRLPLYGELSACRHRSQYIGLRNPDSPYDKAAFILDYTDQRLGAVWTDALHTATALWNDIADGRTLYMAGKRVYWWDPVYHTPAPEDDVVHAPTGTKPMPYRWVSKTFNLIEAVNLAACEITLSADVLQPAQRRVRSDPHVGTQVTLPDGSNCTFRLRANGQVVFEYNVTRAPVCTFRLPSGYKSHLYQFEIVASVEVSKVKLATSMAELNGV